MHIKTILTSSTLQSNSTNRLPCTGDDGALRIYGSCLPWHRLKKAVWAARASSSRSYTHSSSRGFLPFPPSLSASLKLCATQNFSCLHPRVSVLTTLTAARGLCDSSSRIKQGKISISLCFKPPEILVKIEKLLKKCSRNSERPFGSAHIFSS